MSVSTLALRDSATMLRRDLRHAMRYPMLAVGGLLVPVFLLLLFVGVFGNTLHAELGAAAPAGGHYIDYLTPGILVITAGASAAATAINVCIDMNEGIVARFRTMAITRTSVLTGQVLGSLTRTLISAVLIVAVAVGLGFRSSAGPLEWLAVAGLFAGLTLRPHLDRDCVWSAGQNPCWSQQPLADPAVPALHQQRFRADLVDARRGALVRRAPTLHPDHRHPSRSIDRNAGREHSDRGRCVVRGPGARGVCLVPGAIQPLREPLACLTDGTDGWSQGMESNHRYTVLQTAALTTWLPWAAPKAARFRGNG